MSDVETRKNEVADRVEIILQRLDDLRLPFRKRREERRLKRKQVVNGFFEGMRKSRSGKTENEEAVKEENARLKRQLKKEKKEEEEGSRFSGVRRTKDGKEIAVEL